jgi:transcriptional regulator with XRE-family HTH domain
MIKPVKGIMTIMAKVTDEPENSEDAENTAIGSFIQEKRTFRGFSTGKLAEIAGISHTELRRIESGLRTQPSPQILRNIAAALSIPCNDIMAIAGYIDIKDETEHNLRL